MTLEIQLKEIAMEIKEFIETNNVKYGEIKIVIKDNQLHKLTVAKEKLINN